MNTELVSVLEHFIVWCDRCTYFGTLLMVSVVPRVAFVVSSLPGLLLMLRVLVFRCLWLCLNCPPLSLMTMAISFCSVFADFLINISTSLSFGIRGRGWTWWYLPKFLLPLFSNHQLCSELLQVCPLRFNCSGSKGSIAAQFRNTAGESMHHANGVDR